MRLGLGFWNSVDLEEVVEHNEEHSGGAEEDGEAVEIVVGDHVGGCSVVDVRKVIGRCLGTRIEVDWTRQHLLELTL